MFSRKSKYALIAVVALASGDWEHPRLIEDLARQEKLPRKFLEAILLDLRDAGILRSKKGRGGGYHLARAPETITVAEIYKVIDGSPIPYRCVAIRADKTCEECRAAGLCSIGPMMRAAEAALNTVLAGTTIRDLAEKKASLAANDPAADPMYFI